MPLSLPGGRSRSRSQKEDSVVASIAINAATEQRRLNVYKKAVSGSACMYWNDAHLCE